MLQERMKLLEIQGNLAVAELTTEPNRERNKIDWAKVAQDSKRLNHDQRLDYARLALQEVGLDQDMQKIAIEGDRLDAWKLVNSPSFLKQMKLLSMGPGNMMVSALEAFFKRRGIDIYSTDPNKPKTAPERSKYMVKLEELYDGLMDYIKTRSRHRITGQAPHPGLQLLAPPKGDYTTSHWPRQ